MKTIHSAKARAQQPPSRHVSRVFTSEVPVFAFLVSIGLQPPGHPRQTLGRWGRCETTLWVFTSSFVKYDSATDASVHKLSAGNIFPFIVWKSVAFLFLSKIAYAHNIIPCIFVHCYRILFGNTFDIRARL